MNAKNTKNPMTDGRGIAPVMIAIIVAAILLVGGTGAYLVVLNRSAKRNPPPPVAGAPALTPQEVAEDPDSALDALAIGAPEFDVSASPLKPLETSALNLAAPELASTGLFKNVAVSSDFSYTGDTTITAPTVTLDVPTAAAPTTPTSPTTPTAPTGGQTTDCAQFSSVPSCSYVGAPDSPGYGACKQCYPNK